MNRAIASVMLLVIVMIGAEGTACEDHESCEDCVADASLGCEWLVLQNCTATCRAKSYSYSSTLLSTPWRSRQTTNTTHANLVCASKQDIETCTLLPTTDGSFEDRTWKETNSISTTSSLICDSSCAQDTRAFDGTYFVFFGGFQAAQQTASVSHSMTIPRTATHLSFYVSHEDLYSKTRLEVLVDDNLVYIMDHTHNPSATPQYQCIEVSIAPWADGTAHTVMFKIHAITQSLGLPAVLVDYVYLITSDRVGSTPQASAATTCALGCLPSYLEDSECDSVCDNLQCSFDMGVCNTGGSNTCRDGVAPKPSYFLPSQCAASLASSSCCPSLATSTFIATRGSSVANHSTKCSTTSACVNYENELLCSVCSPDSRSFTADTGRLQVCSDFAVKAWAECQTTWRETASGECVMLANIYSSLDLWISSFGADLVSSSNGCLGGSDTKSSSNTGLIIGIAAGAGAAAVAVIVLASVVVILVIRARRQSAPLSGPLDNNNAMTRASNLNTTTTNFNQGISMASLQTMNPEETNDMASGLSPVAALATASSSVSNPAALMTQVVVEEDTMGLQLSPAPMMVGMGMGMGMSPNMGLSPNLGLSPHMGLMPNMMMPTGISPSPMLPSMPGTSPSLSAGLSQNSGGHGTWY